jgi:hypothetical protein
MKLCFVIPAHGRVELADACFGVMRWTCDAVAESGLQATCVVVADDENLASAQKHGFGTVERGNESLGAKFNDGFCEAIELGADLIVPCGSDDIVHPKLVLLQAMRAEADAALDTPSFGKMYVTRSSVVVSETGEEAAQLYLSYEGGDGVRVLTRELLEVVDGRPADEDIGRGMDTSMRKNLTQAAAGFLHFEYATTVPWWITDFKSPDNLNGYGDTVKDWGVHTFPNPFERLAELYPEKLLKPIQEVYA